ncbi:Protein transporter [Rhodotorula toruloides ATCC 204091]|uniref:BY PROTMAP: gi/342319069/gb/EGU11020.1/ Protein transporter [Rhodotorula glutinis ATCC 204091] n=2 Tax=Rhodotorula toruloides TaxID=5286 RepID=A0A0K3C858_RHOTO|nr:Protein transporter [Rhodotorula toruloides ATCC 204091]
MTRPPVARSRYLRPISTATFLPLVLYEQFKFFYKFYFSLVALSQFVPALRIGFLATYIVPLAFVLAFAIGKEAFDDYKRYLRDRAANAALYSRLLVFLEKNDRVPADVPLLRTSDPSGTCFVRTDQLDIETDWQLRVAVERTQALQSDADLLAIEGDVYADPPTKDIHTFAGTLTLRSIPASDEKQERMPPMADNMLWANTVLAAGNAFGIVVYTDPEVRAIMNTSQPGTKVGLLDHEINRLAKILCAVTFALSVILVAHNGFRGALVGVCVAVPPPLLEHDPDLASRQSRHGQDRLRCPEHALPNKPTTDMPTPVPSLLTVTPNATLVGSPRLPPPGPLTASYDMDALEDTLTRMWTRKGGGVESMGIKLTETRTLRPRTPEEDRFFTFGADYGDSERFLVKYAWENRLRIRTDKGLVILFGWTPPWAPFSLFGIDGGESHSAVAIKALMAAIATLSGIEVRFMNVEPFAPAVEDMQRLNEAQNDDDEWSTPAPEDDERAYRAVNMVLLQQEPRPILGGLVLGPIPAAYLGLDWDDPTHPHTTLLEDGNFPAQMIPHPVDTRHPTDPIKHSAAQLAFLSYARTFLGTIGVSVGPLEEFYATYQKAYQSLASKTYLRRIVPLDRLRSNFGRGFDFEDPDLDEIDLLGKQWLPCTVEHAECGRKIHITRTVKATTRSNRKAILPQSCPHCRQALSRSHVRLAPHTVWEDVVLPGDVEKLRRTGDIV